MSLLRTIFPCRATLTNYSKTYLRKSYSVDHNNRSSPLLASTQAQQTFSAIQDDSKRWYATEKKSDDTARLERIYYGSLAPRMKAVKVFSLLTSGAGIAAQPILLEQGTKFGGTGLGVFLCTVAGFFTFVTPFLLHFITKKYVTEMHYNAATDEYIATTISLLLKRIETKFRPEDVNVPEVPGMFTSFIVGKKALFVDPMFFDDPEHYARIMGLDKPVDFKLAPKDSSPNTETTKTN